MPRTQKDQATHALQGTTSQANVPGQSAVPAGRPKLPKGLSTSARAAFKDACRALEARRALTPGDAYLLKLFAVLTHRHEMAQAKLDEEGMVRTYTRLNNHGEEVETEKHNLHLRIAQDCEARLISILDRLGLSPRARDYVRPTAPRKKKPASIPGSVAWALEQESQQQAEQETEQQTAPDFSDVDGTEI
jgi:P27 family predicted phage terminase small subunit